MKIREANLADAAGIARVHIDSWRSTYAGIVPASHLAGFNYQDRSERWQQMLTNQQAGNFVYVAETDQGEIVGFATGGPEQDGHPVYKGNSTPFISYKPRKGVVWANS